MGAFTSKPNRIDITREQSVVIDDYVKTLDDKGRPPSHPGYSKGKNRDESKVVTLGSATPPSSKTRTANTFYSRSSDRLG